MVKIDASNGKLSRLGWRRNNQVFHVEKLFKRKKAKKVNYGDFEK